MNKAYSFLLLFLAPSIAFPAAQKKNIEKSKNEFELQKCNPPSPTEVESESKIAEASILEALNEIEVFDAQLTTRLVYFGENKGLHYDHKIRFTVKNAEKVKALIYEVCPSNQKKIIETAFKLAKEKTLIMLFPMTQKIADDCAKKHIFFMHELQKNIKDAFLPMPIPEVKRKKKIKKSGLKTFFCDKSIQIALSLPSKPELKPRNKWRFLS